MWAIESFVFGLLLTSHIISPYRGLEANDLRTEKVRMLDVLPVKDNAQLRHQLRQKSAGVLKVRLDFLTRPRLSDTPAVFQLNINPDLVMGLPSGNLVLILVTSMLGLFVAIRLSVAQRGSR